MRRMKQEPVKLYEAIPEYVNEHKIRLHITLPDEKTYVIKVIFPCAYFNDSGTIVAELYPCTNNDYSIDPPGYMMYSTAVINAQTKLNLCYEARVDEIKGFKGRFLPKNFDIVVYNEQTVSFDPNQIEPNKVYYELIEVSDPLLVQFI